MAAILRTRDRILIHLSQPALLGIALQVSRNLYQYFRADSEIIYSHDPAVSHRGNVVHLACGVRLTPSALSSYPICVRSKQGLSLRRSGGHTRSYQFQRGLGAAFLRPLPEEQTELVIWGFDEDGLRSAARLLPLLTGTAQPDFVVVSKECGWKGASGALATGFLDSCWEISESSYIT